MLRASANYPGILFAANGDQFARSNDSGASWELVDGPWRGNRIIGLALQDQRAALLLDSRRRLEVVIVDDFDNPVPRINRHSITLALDARLDPQDVGGFELFGRRVLVTGKRKIWTGTLPEKRRALGDGLAVLATLAGAILLIAIAFGFIRLTFTLDARK